MMDNNNCRQQRVEHIPPSNPGPTVQSLIRGALWLAGVPVPKPPRQ
jgi:hypothetical protein